MDRSEFFAQASEFATYVSVATDEGEFVVATSDGGTAQSLINKRSRPEFRILRRVVGLIKQNGVEMGGTFIDVGANIGTTTVCALHSHGFSSAVALEPEPENFRLLRANLALNGFADRVEALNVAASDQQGEALLAVIADRPGKSWVGTTEQIAADEAQYERALADHPEKLTSRRGGRRPKIEGVEIDLVTVDSLDIADPGLLWIDAESHEGQVLRGATKLLEHGPPLVTELHPHNLIKRGDLNAVLDAAQAYTHFADIRRRKNSGFREVSELREFAEMMDEEESFTDLLLLRLAST